MQQLAILAFPLLTAIIFHELAHGYVAWLLGDPTAKKAGRLTLNPIKHLDFLGTLVFVFSQVIGWAKPVPIDPRYFRNPRQGWFLVSLAGPMANFILAVVFALLFNAARIYLPEFFKDMADYQEGGTVILILKILASGVLLNLALGFFNLLPIPPLDGSKMLMTLMPARMAGEFLRLERYGMIIIIVLSIIGVLAKIIFPAVMFFRKLLIGM